MYDKSIQYDRETRDYAMRLDGELVGFARTHHEAEITLDQLVFELMSSYRKYDGPDPRTPTTEAPADDPIAIDPPTTCCFCSKPHHPQDCPEMRALLFAPSICTCTGNDFDPICDGCIAAAQMGITLPAPHGMEV